MGPSTQMLDYRHLARESPTIVLKPVARAAPESDDDEVPVLTADKLKRIKPCDLTSHEIRYRIMDCFKRVDPKTGRVKTQWSQKEMRLATRVPLHLMWPQVIKLCDFHNAGAHKKSYTLKKLYA